MSVAVLFARSDSIYKSMPGCDVYDKDRDARNFKGGAKVVAHPPCRSWSRMRHFARPEPGEKELALLAIDFVRKNGGVLEHPASSSLFLNGHLPLPGQHDEFGFTTCVDQYWWGHLARKRTWLYIVGVSARDLPVMPIVLGDAEFVCCGVGARSKRKKTEISKAWRERTPVDFAHWLCEVARRAVV